VCPGHRRQCPGVTTASHGSRTANRLKPPRSILQKWSIMVNTGLLNFLFSNFILVKFLLKEKQHFFDTPLCNYYITKSKNNYFRVFAEDISFLLCHKLLTIYTN